MIPNVSVPTYPNVPQAPGVPPLLRQAGAIESTVVLLAADAATIINAFGPPQWGLFTTSGTSAFASPLSGAIGTITSALGFGGGAPSVIDVAYKGDARVSTAPQEQGAFMSYNKVQDPFNARLKMAQGGTNADRNAFLTALETAKTSLTLYTLMMPEISYPNVNVVHYDFMRTATNGVTLIVADIWLEQIRQVGSPQFSSTATPGGAATSNSGTVQPQTPTAAQNPNAAGQQSVNGAGGIT